MLVRLGQESRGYPSQTESQTVRQRSKWGGRMGKGFSGELTKKTLPNFLMSVVS